MEILIKLIRQIFGWDDKAENLVLGINLKGSWESSWESSHPNWIPRPRKNNAHPDNVPGPFYTEDCCIICGAPEAAAPELIGWVNYSKEGMNCIFVKQPETQEEVEMAITAMDVSCVQNLRYRGDDPAILEKLQAMGYGHLCDVLEAQ